MSRRSRAVGWRQSDAVSVFSRENSELPPVRAFDLPVRIRRASTVFVATK